MKIKMSDITLDVKSISYKHYRIPEYIIDKSRLQMTRYSPKLNFFDPDLDIKVKPSSRGGRTEVQIEINAGDEIYTSYYGCAKCSLEDNFCYAEGRRQALADAISNILAQNRITRTKKFVLEIANEIQLGFSLSHGNDTLVIDMQTGYVAWQAKNNLNEKSQ